MRSFWLLSFLLALHGIAVTRGADDDDGSCWIPVTRILPDDLEQPITGDILELSSISSSSSSSSVTTRACGSATRQPDGLQAQWFVATGNGQVWEITTCVPNNNNNINNLNQDTPAAVSLSKLPVLDTQLKVFSLQPDNTNITKSCLTDADIQQNLQCVTGNDDSFAKTLTILTAPCLVESTVTISTAFDQDYYIQVHGYLRLASPHAYSKFQLQISTIQEETPPPSECLAPQNRTTTLELNEIVMGTFDTMPFHKLDASFQVVNACNENNHNDSKEQRKGGNWYKYIASANDDILMATTCTGNPDHALEVIPTQITVYQQTVWMSNNTTTTCPVMLECLGTSKLDFATDACPNHPAVTWQTAAKTEYWIHVQAVVETEKVFNDIQDDDDAIVSDQNYYLVLRPVSSLAPTVSPTSRIPENDSCQTAIELQVNDLIAGRTFSNFNNQQDDSSICNATTAVWYSVMGTGETLQASTCSGYAQFDELTSTQIVVVAAANQQEGCTDWTCVADSVVQEQALLVSEEDEECKGSTSVSWKTATNVPYYILVAALDEMTTGPFVLSVRAIPDNDFCTAATDLTPELMLQNSTTVSGTTVGGSLDGADFCGTASQQSTPGVWYTLETTSETVITATTCVPGPQHVTGQDTSTFDTQIHVFTGNNCSSLECVTANDDGSDGLCRREAGVTWTAEPDTVYYILVHGFRMETGNFSLLVQLQDDDIGMATQAPTGPPENDVCDGAIGPLLPGFVLEGNTVTATNDEQGICGDTSEQFSGGLWYYLLGDGMTYKITTCHGDLDISDGGSIDTELKIYTGDCNNLICVDGNDDDNTDECGTESGLILSTELGQLYYILVHGFGTVEGVFGLAMLADTPAPTQTPLANDNCLDAMGPLELGQVVEGALQDATSEFVPACGQATAQVGPGLWYTFETEQEQQTVFATTCTGNPDHDVSFQTQISVYTGFDCDALECFAGGGDVVDDGCVGEAGVVWTARANVTYYILVHSVEEIIFGGFHLVIRDSTFAPTMAPTGMPDNDECTSATGPLPIGTILDGTTAGATPDGMPPCGLASNQTSAGVWYTVVGTGQTIKASTCTLYKEYDSLLDSQIAVYRGTSCNALECVTGNDDDPYEECSRSSSAVWDSVEGELYYILIHGFAESQGPFVLSIRHAPRNDECQLPVPLELNVVETGSIVGAAPDKQATCGTAAEQTTGGVWYSLQGTGGVLLATTCIPVSNETTAPSSTAARDDTIFESEFDTQLTVYQGDDCDGLTCITGGNFPVFGDCTRDFEASVLWETVANMTYRILVHGVGYKTGRFQLVVQETTAAPTMSPTAPAANDFCVDAIDLQVDQVVEGSTFASSNDFTDACGDAFPQTSAGVWYSFTGQGATVLATTCHGNLMIGDSFFDSQIKVYTGGCDDLQCLTGNDDDLTDSCGTESAVSWFAEAGVEYKILIHGWGGGSGRFGIVIRPQQDPEPQV